MSEASPSASGRDHDSSDLAGFGYRQRLDRTLGGFSSFAASFSYLSILTGGSQLFHLGFAAGGPAFFWTWPVVLAGQMLVALCFAELAAHYPLSGGVYQWSKLVGSGSAGWMAGWVYLACAIITLAATSLALQTTLPQLLPFFQLVGPAGDRAAAARNAVILASGLVALTTLINAVGVKLLARVNNVGVFVEMLATIGLIGLLTWYARRSPAVVFNTAGKGDGTTFGYLLGPALSASLMATFVLYGFDTAGSLAEETDDPRRRAPRAILLALFSVGLGGSLIVLGVVRSVPNLADPALGEGSGGLPYAVKTVLGAWLGLPLLAGITFSIIVCTLTVHAAAVRVVFAMARDNHLPFSHALARVNEGTRTPALPAVVVGVGAAALLLLNVNHPHVIELLACVAIVWANLAYLFVTVPLLRRRLVRPVHPRAEGEGFSLGRAGLVVNLLAVLWGVALVLNIGWPRAELYGEGWLGATGALGPTLAMLVLGLIYDRGFRRRRPVGVLAEHRAHPPHVDEVNFELATITDGQDEDDAEGGEAEPATVVPKRRRRLIRFRLRRPTRPRS